MPRPVSEGKLSTKLAFSETQRRSVRLRESPNDEGKNPATKKVSFCQFITKSFRLPITSTVRKVLEGAKLALECFFSYVSIWTNTIGV